MMQNNARISRCNSSQGNTLARRERPVTGLMLAPGLIPGLIQGLFLALALILFAGQSRAMTDATYPDAKQAGMQAELAEVGHAQQFASQQYEFALKA